MTNGWTDFFAQIAVILPAFLLALTFHEFSHALVAYLLGDDTAKKMGRLTLNPLAHVDFIGLLFLILIRFGWAKPVPFDHRNFKHPKLYSVITALSGPFANFLLALVCLYAVKYIPMANLEPAIIKTFVQIFATTAYVNIMLGVFNLLPLPMLDGSHILTVMLMDRYPKFILWLYRYSFFILLILILLPPVQAFLIRTILAVEILLQSLVI
ncbi:MAG: Zn-dependent protease [candidate division TM6 bacterium GW2011_GWF2_37_49]|nr:MAG: Zn-dependent protease [candidate division TM6 bacterium GW2011_GWF2_37_49]